MAEFHRPHELSYELKAQDTYPVGKGVVVEFTLHNQSGERLWALNWYTPLEGINGNIFTVTLDGHEAAYRGRMIKRGEPSHDDYVRLDPGESVSATVDLAGDYDLTKPGEVRVEFRDRIDDLIRGPSLTLRSREAHVSVTLAEKSVNFSIVDR